MASNREDFQNSEVLDELREIILLSLQWMTLQWSHYKATKAKKKFQEETERFQERQKERKKENDEDKKGTLEQFASNESDNKSESDKSDENDSSEEAVDGAIEFLEGVAETATETISEDDRQVSDEAVDTATRVIRSSLDQKEQEIDFFRSAFSVNQVVFSFSHELRSMVNSLGGSASRIEAAINDIPKSQQSEFEEIVENLRDMQDRFENQMELFGIFMETGSRRQASREKVGDVVDDVISATEYIADYYDAEIKSEVPSVLRTPPIHKSELYSVLINPVTNSIKAVGASDGKANRILIEGSQTSDGIQIRVYDTGVGIPEPAQDEAFDPLISDPVDNIYDSLF